MLLPFLWRVIAGPNDLLSFGSASVRSETQLDVNQETVVVREPSGTPYRSCRHDKNRCAANDVRRDVSVVQKREFRYVRRQT